MSGGSLKLWHAAPWPPGRSVLPEPMRWQPAHLVVVTDDLADPRLYSDHRLAGVWAVMALTARHRYLVVTDTPGRLAGRVEDPEFRMAVGRHATDIIGRMPPHLGRWRLDMGGARLAGDSGIRGGWQTITAPRLDGEGGDTLWVPPWPLAHVTVYAPIQPPIDQPPEGPQP